MQKLKLFGTQDSPLVYTIRDFLLRSVVDFEWVEVNKDTTFTEGYMSYLTDTPELPAVLFPDGDFIINPTLEEVADRLGWIHKPAYDEYDLAIYGAGPAGLSAAVYAASEGLKTLMVERDAMGGQAGTSSLIENYMGFPEGISGADLAERARQQATKFGADILQLREKIKGCFSTGRFYAELSSGDHVKAKAVLFATGIEYEKLHLPGESQFFHKGVYYGAGASEASFCTGKDVFVVGGGNSAGQAASHFSGFARKVYVVVRKGNLKETLSSYLEKRITAIPNIEILYNSEVKALEGDGILQRIKIVNRVAQTETWFNTNKLFLCIGGSPNTDWAADAPIIRDDSGYLMTGSDLVTHHSYKEYWTQDRLPYHLETSVPGAFAAGDVRHNSVKRVASAVGEGAMAVMFVHQYLATI